MLNYRKIVEAIRRRSRWALAAVVLALTAGLIWLRSGHHHEDAGATFVAWRGPLEIAVLDGGSIESEEKGEIKCEVKGGQGVKILKIVEEGYQVTDDDVKTNRVLVELDSADIRSKITQQEISFGSTAASLIDAEQTYDIQVNQNLSDVKSAEQKATFARMDFEKYLGDKAAEEVLAQLGANSLSPGELSPPPTPADPLASVITSVAPDRQNLLDMLAPTPPPLTVGTNGLALPMATTDPASAVNTLSMAAVDFSKYADINLLGDGEAKQKLREAQDAVQIAQKELQQAQSTLEGTKRLFDKDFVTRIELDKDQLASDNAVLKVKKADTALNLFTKYEFRKAAQEALSKYLESLRELGRTRKGAVSKLAQADAKLKSAQARYAVEDKQFQEVKEQLEKCLIKARRPGLVVYGSGGEIRYWRDEEQIREGVTVREGQTVLTIPDMRRLCIKVRIHESYIKRIAKGQKVHIAADAFPDRKLEGEVSQVGVLPDSENAWLNPDMKVYRTTINIHGQHDWIRPGMSTKLQIVVNRLDDVVQVPVQAVHPLVDKRICYVLNRSKVEQREVEIGEFNDEFIEIKKGINEGERVCLRPPSAVEEKPGSEQKPGRPGKTAPKSESKVAARPTSTTAK